MELFLCYVTFPCIISLNSHNPLMRRLSDLYFADEEIWPQRNEILKQLIFIDSDSKNFTCIYINSTIFCKPTHWKLLSLLSPSFHFTDGEKRLREATSLA